VKGCCVFGEGERDEGMTVARARVWMRKREWEF
jgi:hypothetical protein